MEYVVKIAPHALQQIDEALDYIANKLQSPKSARTVVRFLFYKDILKCAYGWILRLRSE